MRRARIISAAIGWLPLVVWDSLTSRGSLGLVTGECLLGDAIGGPSSPVYGYSHHTDWLLGLSIQDHGCHPKL